MPRRFEPILVDTNVILECHRVGSWRALAGGDRLETVEECVTETLTGHQHRRPEQQVDLTALRQSIALIHVVAAAHRAEAAVKDDLFARLDPASATCGRMR